MHMFCLCFALLWLIISTYGFLWFNFNLISCSNKDTGSNTQVLMQMSVFYLCAWSHGNFWVWPCDIIPQAVGLYTQQWLYKTSDVDTAGNESICCTEWYMITGSNQNVKLPVCCMPISLSKIIFHEICTCFGCALLWFWFITSTYGFLWWIYP